MPELAFDRFKTPKSRPLGIARCAQFRQLRAWQQWMEDLILFFRLLLALVVVVVVVVVVAAVAVAALLKLLLLLRRRRLLLLLLLLILLLLLLRSPDTPKHGPGPNLCTTMNTWNLRVLRTLGALLGVLSLQARFRA